MIHLLLHALVPAMVARAAFDNIALRAYAIMMATMLVDLDHLLADPVYDPGRCSIGFHPLHSVVPIAIYVALCFVPRVRLIGLGLVIHMLLDALDCVVMAV